MTSSRPLPEVWTPTPRQLEAAADLTVPDVLGPGLDLLLVGINPGLYTAAVGHHFARPGNRFWKAMYAGGFTPRLLSAFEDATLLDLGIGITNVVARSSATAGELTRQELVEGGRELREKLRLHRPRSVAFLGIGAYRLAFDRAGASVGPQTEHLEGARVWVLPNPSGLNAHYSLEKLGALFRELHDAIRTPSTR